MRILTTIVAVAAFMILAAVPAKAADFKVGVVKVAEVLKESEPGKKAFAELQKESKKIGQEIERRKKELEKFSEGLQKQRMMLSLEAKQDKELEFKRKARDYEDMVRNYQRKMQTDQAKLSKPILETLSDVMTEYAKKNNFDMVFDGSGPNSNLFYFKDSLDITDPIIRELNTAWRKK